MSSVLSASSIFSIASVLSVSSDLLDGLGLVGEIGVVGEFRRLGNIDLVAELPPRPTGLLEVDGLGLICEFGGSGTSVSSRTSVSSGASVSSRTSASSGAAFLSRRSVFQKIGLCRRPRPGRWCRPTGIRRRPTARTLRHLPARTRPPAPRCRMTRGHQSARSPGRCCRLIGLPRRGLILRVARPAPPEESRRDFTSGSGSISENDR